MEKYELMFIISPDLSEQSQAELVDKIKNIIQTKSGKILELEPWGKRDMASTISGKKQGVYQLLRYEGSGEINSALTDFFKITEEILRHMVIKVKTAEKKADQKIEAAAETMA